jgi:hypothetical protein
MIHQFIFAGPKPGLSPAAFQMYWVHFHAVEFTRKIPQIRRYLVATREPVEIANKMPFFEGVAEIWLASDADQISSMQTPEFLQGSRLDEPRWAAFWQTFVLDTESRTVWEESAGDTRSLTKLYVLLKRKPGSARGTFNTSLSGDHAALVRRLPGLRRHTIALARDNQYGFGEPRFDAIEVYAFDDAAAVDRAVHDAAYGDVEDSWRTLADETARFTFAGLEHWVIRPEAAER